MKKHLVPNLAPAVEAVVAAAEVAVAQKVEVVLEFQTIRHHHRQQGPSRAEL
jgi:hypothetical protein